jgi:hypothetical protein
MGVGFFLSRLVGSLVGLLCLTPLSTIIQLNLGGKFYWWIAETGVPGENHRPVVSH